MAGENWGLTGPPDDPEPTLWELFHENSKRGSSVAPPEVSLGDDAGGLGLDCFPVYALPEELVPLNLALSAVLQRERVPARLVPQRLTLPQLATLLYCAAGTYAERHLLGEFDGSCWATGSPTGLHATELLVHARQVEGLPVGLYAYDAPRHQLRQLANEDQTGRIASALGPRHLAVQASMLVFLVARAGRLIDNLGERGYRITLMGVGQIFRSLEVTATALGLGCVGISEYNDRKIDQLLGVDGLLTSATLLATIGGLPAADA